MGLTNYLAKKAEGVMMAGALGHVQRNPDSNMQIGATLDACLSHLLPDQGYRAQDIMDGLSTILSLASFSTETVRQSKDTYMTAADFHRRAGEKPEMYASSMLSALYRRAEVAASGKQQDIASFDEMAVAISNCIAAYRLWNEVEAGKGAP